MWLTSSRFMTWQYPGVVSVRLQSYLVEGHQLQGTTACLLLHSSENTQLMLHSLGRGHRAQNLSLLCVKALKNLSCRASHPWKCETSGKKLLLTVLFTRQKNQVSWGQLQANEDRTKQSFLSYVERWLCFPERNIIFPKRSQGGQ